MTIRPLVDLASNLAAPVGVCKSHTGASLNEAVDRKWIGERVANQHEVGVEFIVPVRDQKRGHGLPRVCLHLV